VLAALEQKLAALVGDAVAARTDLSVVAGGDDPAPDVGRGVVRAAVAELAAESGFVPDDVLVHRQNGTSRRLLPVGFQATLEFVRRPTAASAAAARTARRLLLEDVSLVAHALAAAPVRAGGAFAVADPDPGFEVRGFGLGVGATPAERDDGLFTGLLRYGGRAVLWPPGAPQQEGVVLAVDALTSALPLTIGVDAPVVAAGGTTTIRIRGVGGQRLLDVDPFTQEPLQLALAVLSDLPPGERGIVESGTQGVETGVRLVTVGDLETTVVYRAPAPDAGPVVSETVAVHLATPEGVRGVFLGATAVLVAEGA